MRSALRNRWLMLAALLVATGYVARFGPSLFQASIQGPRYTYYTPQESANGITVTRGKYAVMSCAGRGSFPVMTSALRLASGSLNFSVFQYPRQKSAPGVFFHSESKMRAVPSVRPDSRLTLLDRGSRYNIFTVDRDLAFTCGVGLDLVRLCGDGFIVTPETCDDGNAGNGDGCDSQCNIESGFTCTGSPGVCTRFPQCSNGLDDDGDGGVDLPGAMTAVTRVSGSTILNMRWPPFAVQDFWYPIKKSSTNTLMGIFDMRSGAEVLTLDPGDSGSSGFYDEPSNTLFVTRLAGVAGVKMSGTSSRVVGFAGPGGSYDYAGGPYFRSGTDTMYVLYTDNQYPYALSGFPLVYEIDKTTMQKTGEVAVPLFSATGSHLVVYDDVRHKMYLLDQRPGAVGTVGKDSFIIREVDLDTMTLTGRQKVIGGERVYDESFRPLLANGTTQTVLLDAERGLLYILQNPRSDNLYRTKIRVLSLDSFDLIHTLTVHDGSTNLGLVTVDGTVYNRLLLGFLGLTKDGKIAASANYGNGGTSRTMFMLFSSDPEPVLLSTISNLPPIHTEWSPPQYVMVAFDPGHSVVYIRPVSPPEHPPDMRWMTVNLKNGEVMRAAPQEMFGTMWAYFSRAMANGKEFLFIPAVQNGQMFDVRPSAVLNLGDSLCTDGADNSESS